METLKLVTLTEARTQADAMKTKILLGRANIPYTTRHELSLLYTAQGPITFLVEASSLPLALAKLEEAFEIHQHDIPEACPACNAQTLPPKTDCPECGLFLG